MKTLPVVRISLLPPQSQEQLKSLFDKLVVAAVNASPAVKSENDIIILFSADLMQYGLGTELLVEFSPGCNGLVRDPILEMLRDTFPQASIQHWTMSGVHCDVFRLPPKTPLKEEVS